MSPLEIKKFIVALQAPNIRPFIDTSKLLMSSQFDAAAEFAITCRITSGDSSFIQAILDVFATSSSYKAVLLWFCDRGALSFSESQGKIRLHLSKEPRKTSANLAEYLCTHKGSKQNLLTIPEPVKSNSTSKQKLAKIFGPEDGRKGGNPFLRGGAPGLRRR